jgi:hypothetical protein
VIEVVIEVVAHMLQREEVGSILDHLGYARAAASDSMMIESTAAFIATHVDSSFRDLGSRSGGTRSKEAQAAHSLIGKAAASQELVGERLITQAAARLGMRAATFRMLIDERKKMDAECGSGSAFERATLLGSESGSL